MRISDWSSDVCSSDLSFEVVAWSTREVAGSPSPERAISTSGTDRARAITEVDRVRDRFMRSLGPRHGRCSGKKESGVLDGRRDSARSEEHTSELQSLMRISYAVFCLKKKK